MATYTSNFRQFSKVPFEVTAIYPAYRAGGYRDANDKFHFSEFKDFPQDDRQIVDSGDDIIMENKDSDKREFRKQVWNKDRKIFEFHKIEEKIDRDFFKTYKKVYDIAIRLEKETEVNKYKDIFETTDEVVLKGISAYKLQEMLRAYDLEEDIELVKAKNRDGEEVDALPFDWEDLVKDELVNKGLVVTITGQWLDTKYKFKTKDIAPKSEEDPFEKAKTKAKDEISIEDVPF